MEPHTNLTWWMWTLDLLHVLSTQVRSAFITAADSFNNALTAISTTITTTCAATIKLTIMTDFAKIKNIHCIIVSQLFIGYQIKYS